MFLHAIDILCNNSWAGYGTVAASQPKSHESGPLSTEDNNALLMADLTGMEAASLFAKSVIYLGSIRPIRHVLDDFDQQTLNKPTQCPSGF